jgi:hypothetical protein
MRPEIASAADSFTKRSTRASARVQARGRFRHFHRGGRNP